MKKQLTRWALLMLFALVSAPIMAGSALAVTGSEDREISVKGMSAGDEEGSILRSIRMPIIKAWISDDLLKIDFTGTGVHNTTVVITNQTTGAVAYEGEYPNPGEIFIDLSMEDAGTYLLEMRMPYWYFSGVFDLY